MILSAFINDILKFVFTVYENSKNKKELESDKTIHIIMHDIYNWHKLILVLELKNVTQSLSYYFQNAV